MEESGVMSVILMILAIPLVIVAALTLVSTWLSVESKMFDCKEK